MKRHIATKRILAGIMTAVITGGLLVIPAAADEPYTGYNYDWWSEPIPSQNGYVVERVVTGPDLGLEDNFRDPEDMFIYEETGEIYIADSKNNRIVIADGDLDASKTRVMDKFVYSADYPLDDSKIGTETLLNTPMGVFVMKDNRDVARIYIADFNNERILACYENGEVFMEYTRPASDVYPAQVSYNPKKVLVDKALNVYVLIPSITSGAVVFSVDGSFNSFYGANRVEATAEIVYRQILRLFMTREQLTKMRRAVPIEFSNFDIDQDGFIYTVTSARSADTDIFKKLNPAGANVFVTQGYDDYTFGDFNELYVNGITYKSSIVDVDIDSFGDYLLLDRTMGRVFQYSADCDLMFTFGAGGSRNNQQKGTFVSPVALETYGTNVYVLDSRKSSITVFARTEFGAVVHTAMTLFNKGFYGDSVEPWEDVLRRDANYYYGYVGLGNAYLAAGDYDTAMDYFYRISRRGYDSAYKEYRINVIRDNFTWVALIVVVLVVGIAVFDNWRRRRAKQAFLKQKKEADNNES